LKGANVAGELRVNERITVPSVRLVKENGDITEKESYDET